MPGFRVIGFAGVVAVVAAVASAQEMDFASMLDGVVEAGGGSELVTVSDMALTERATEIYETEFKGAGHFAAFAVSGSGAYGFAVAANSRAAAQEMALIECQRFAEACQIHSEILPAGYDALADGALVLSSEAQAQYFDPVKQPDHRAMAVSEDGAYSIVWGHKSADEATAAALEKCEANRITVLEGLRDMPCGVLPAN